MTGIQPLGPGDADAMEAANQLFGEVFGEEGYHGPPPSRDHLCRFREFPAYRIAPLQAHQADRPGRRRRGLVAPAIDQPDQGRQHDTRTEAVEHP